MLITRIIADENDSDDIEMLTLEEKPNYHLFESKLDITQLVVINISSFLTGIMFMITLVSVVQVTFCMY